MKPVRNLYVLYACLTLLLPGPAVCRALPWTESAHEKNDGWQTADMLGGNDPSGQLLAETPGQTAVAGPMVGESLQMISSAGIDGAAAPPIMQDLATDVLQVITADPTALLDRQQPIQQALALIGSVLAETVAAGLLPGQDLKQEMTVMTAPAAGMDSQPAAQAAEAGSLLPVHVESASFEPVPGQVVIEDFTGANIGIRMYGEENELNGISFFRGQGLTRKMPEDTEAGVYWQLKLPAGLETGVFTQSYQRPVDARQYKELSFFAKGDTGGETFQIIMRDADGRLTPISAPVTLGTQWQKISVDLADTKEHIDARRIGSMTLVFSNPESTDRSFSIDQFCLQPYSEGEKPPEQAFPSYPALVRKDAIPMAMDFSLDAQAIQTAQSKFGYAALESEPAARGTVDNHGVADISAAMYVVNPGEYAVVKYNDACSILVDSLYANNCVMLTLWDQDTHTALVAHFGWYVDNNSVSYQGIMQVIGEYKNQGVNFGDNVEVRIIGGTSGYSEQLIYKILEALDENGLTNIVDKDILGSPNVNHDRSIRMNVNTGEVSNLNTR